MRPKARINWLASAFMPLAVDFGRDFWDAAAGFVFVCSSAAVTTCITARLRRTIGAKELQNTTLHYCLVHLSHKAALHHSEQLKKNMLSVSPHFRANHPAFAAHRAPPPGTAEDDDADYVLVLASA